MCEEKISLDVDIETICIELEKHCAEGWSPSSFAGKLVGNIHRYSKLLKNDKFRQIVNKYKKKVPKFDKDREEFLNASEVSNDPEEFLFIDKRFKNSKFYCSHGRPKRTCKTCKREATRRLVESL